MPLLQLRAVTKLYPGVRALDSVDLTVSAGSVHALIGENGAGKSTLLKVLAGATRPDQGNLLFEDQRLHFRTPRDAVRHGITVIYQELALMPHLGADANIFLGMERSHIGRKTVEVVAQALAGNSVPPTVAVPVNLVTRDSLVGN